MGENPHGAFDSVRVEYADGRVQDLHVHGGIPARYSGPVAGMLAQLCSERTVRGRQARLLCRFEFMADGEAVAEYESRFGEGSDDDR